MVKPHRNVFCPFYTDCLEAAAEKNLPGFSCDGCRHLKRRFIPSNFDGEVNLLAEILGGIVRRSSPAGRYERSENLPKIPDEGFLSDFDQWPDG